MMQRKQFRMGKKKRGLLSLCFAVLLLMMTILSACSSATSDNVGDGNQIGASDGQYPYDYTVKSFFEVEDCFKYAPKAEVLGIRRGEEDSYFNLAAVDGYTVPQGACTDGIYVYMLMENNSALVDGEVMSACLLYKIDMATWEIVQRSEPLYVDHGNSITYNAKRNQLFVSHTKNHPNSISVIDVNTLTVVEQFELKLQAIAITYNSAYDLYVLRTGSTNHDFAILDADFQELGYYKGLESGLGAQNIYCDDDYIYLLDSGVTRQPGTEAFLVYDWDGVYEGVYRVNSMSETEAMFSWEGEFYISFFVGAGRLYRMEFDKELLKINSKK